MAQHTSAACLQEAAGVEVEHAHAAVRAPCEQAPLVVIEGQGGEA